MSWEKINLGDVCEVIAGQSPPSTTYNTAGKGLPFFQGKADFGTHFPKVRMWCSEPVKIAELNDVLLSVRAPVGPTNICDRESCIGRGLAAIRSNGKTFYKYVYYYFKYIENRLSKTGNGSTFSAITIGDVKTLQIPLPDIEIQQKIASILDQADTLRQADQQLLNKYDELLNGLFYQFFGNPVKNEKGWKKVKLGSICDVGSSKRVFVEELVEDGIPFFRGTEIGSLSEGETITPSLFITQEHYERLKKDTGVPKIGDLLLPSICPDGRIYEVSNDHPFYFKDGRVLWIKVNHDVINGAFLKTCLKQIFATDYLKIASGTTFAELKIFELKKMETVLPPISLQKKFASVIKNIEEQKQLANQQIQKSEKLFHSLLQKAFKGELVK